ncbi:uncharacterized protein [Amphiura filiformis]|uniref:uncharacterized protein n=1 Tax=Amphiura filiformis TaxID=82378 RepID=UPI003B20CECD
MMLRLVVQLLTIAVLAAVVSCKLKPTNYGKEVLCEGCHAAISELNKFLERSKKHNDPVDRRVNDAIKRACVIDHLRAYEFSPPTMKKVCDYWTVDYKEELIDVVKAHIDDKVEQELQLCFEVTDVCVGVDRGQFRINKYKGPRRRKAPKSDKNRKKTEL